jgi:hypothetical protein
MLPVPRADRTSRRGARSVEIPPRESCGQEGKGLQNKKERWIHKGESKAGSGTKQEIE